MKKPIAPAPKPRRSRLIAVKVSEKEYAAMSDQTANDNLASLSDYIRKCALDKAGYHPFRFTPTQLNP